MEVKTNFILNQKENNQASTHSEDVLTAELSAHLPSDGRGRGRVCVLLKLALPIIVAQLGSILQGWADTIMVGQYGTSELSSVGFVNNVYNLVIYFLLGISYASTPVVGNFFGKKDYVETVQAKRSSVVVNFLASMFVVGCLMLLYENIDRLGQPEELMPLIKPYFLILLVSLPFLAVFNAFKQYYDAIGNTRISMLVMLGGNVVNVVLNYILIYGKCGAPELGLMGAGLATLLSRVMMMVALMLYRGDNKEMKAVSAPWRLGYMKRLAILGIPISVQMCLEAGSFNVCALFMGWIGPDALAAHQVMCSVSTIGFMIYYGIGAAAAILISQYRGKGDWKEVKAIARTSMLMSLVAAVTVSVLMCVCSQQIASVFTKSDAVAVLFISFLPCFVCYQFGDCLQSIYANCLRAIEDVKYLMLFAVIAYAIVSVPLAYILAFTCKMGAVGVWWSFPFGLTTAGLLYYIRFARSTCK